MKRFSLLFPFAAASASAAPTPPTPPQPPVTSPSSGSSSNWSFKTGGSEIQIQTTGNVTLDSKSDAVFDLHGSGTLRVTEKAGKDTRVLTAQAGQVTWQVNGVARPFAADGKDWLRKVLDARPPTPTPPTPPAR